MTKKTKLNQLIEDILYAKKYLIQAQNLCRNEALTEKERTSNEGVHFGSALYGLLKDIEKAYSSLHLIQIFRDPEGNKDFIEKLNYHAQKEGAENFTGSLNPPKNTGKESVEESMYKFAFNEEKIRITYELEDKFMNIAAEYKGLVSKDSFTNIAFDMWEAINGEDGSAFPVKGERELL